jgi:hypothetical protein
MKIYRDGVVEAQKNSMTPFVRTNQDFALGGDSVHPYDGLPDEVTIYKIYNRALSDAEILAILQRWHQGKMPAKPIISGLQPSTNGVAISWVSQPGLTYRVQSEPNLSLPSWTDTSGDIIASNATTSTIVQTNAAPQQFYRVRILQ